MSAVVPVDDNCCSCGSGAECRSRSKGGEHEFSGFVPFSPLQIAGSPYPGTGGTVGSQPPAASFRATYAFGQNYGSSAMPVFLDGAVECYRQPPYHFGDPRARKRFLRLVVSGTGWRLGGEADPGYDPDNPGNPFAFSYRHEFWVERHTNAMCKTVFTFDGALTFTEEVTAAGVYSKSGAYWKVWTDQAPTTPSIGPYVNLEPPSYGWKSSSATVTETSASYQATFDYSYGDPLTTVELSESSHMELFDEYTEEDCLAESEDLYNSLTYGGTYDIYFGTYVTPTLLDWGVRIHALWIRDYTGYFPDPGVPPPPPIAPVVIAFARGSGPQYRGAMCEAGTVRRVDLALGFVWGSQMEMSVLPGAHSCFICQEWVRPVVDSDADPVIDNGHSGYFTGYDCVLDLGIGTGWFTLEPGDTIFAQGAGCFQWQCFPTELVSPCYPYQVECNAPPP